MLLTSRTQYAIRALYDLAFHGRGQPQGAKTVAGRQGIPPKFLDLIFFELGRAGLVSGRRGRSGGFVLARPPEAIRLSDILEALQGPLADQLAMATAPGSKPRAAGARARRPAASARPASAESDVPAIVWAEIGTRITEAIASVTLRDMVERAEKLGLRRATHGQLMYFI